MVVKRANGGEQNDSTVESGKGLTEKDLANRRRRDLERDQCQE